MTWVTSIPVAAILMLVVGIEGADMATARAALPADTTCFGVDSAFCAICPADTLIRPGRYADLIHGAVNHTDRISNVFYGIEGERWPPWTLVADLNPIFPGETQLLLLRIAVPDTAAAGVNVMSWWVNLLTCNYRITIPELIASVSVESGVNRVRLSWMVADSAADTATVYRREPGGVWAAIGGVVASVGSALGLEDRDVVPGSSYEYRLGLPVADREIYRGEVTVAVPDLLGGASAEASAGRNLLTWVPADPAAYAAAVYRRMEEGPWTALGTIGTDGGGPLTYEDRAVRPGVGYRYRLGITVEGREFYRGELAVVAAVVDDEFRLEPVSANPTSGPLGVVITLGRGGPARLELFDAGGRRVCTRQVWLRQERSVMDAAGGMWLRPGLYVARLTQGPRQRTLRFAVVR